MESSSGRVAGSVLDYFYPADVDMIRNSGFLVPDGQVTAAAPSLDPTIS